MRNKVTKFYCRCFLRRSQRYLTFDVEPLRVSFFREVNESILSWPEMSVILFVIIRLHVGNYLVFVGMDQFGPLKIISQN